jgi:hypothetical protein
MALSTRGHEVLLDHAGLRVVNLLHVVNAMTVRADCHVRPDIGGLFLVEADGLAVKVVEIGLEDIGGYLVLAHQLFVRMAPGAKAHRRLPEGRSLARRCCDAVTRDANRDIGVVVLCQSGAVDA